MTLNVSAASAVWLVITWLHKFNLLQAIVIVVVVVVWECLRLCLALSISQSGALNQVPAGGLQQGY